MEEITSFPKSGLINWFLSLCSITFPKKSGKDAKHGFYQGVQQMKSNVKDAHVTDSVQPGPCSLLNTLELHPPSSATPPGVTPNWGSTIPLLSARILQWPLGVEKLGPATSSHLLTTVKGAGTSWPQEIALCQTSCYRKPTKHTSSPCPKRELLGFYFFSQTNKPVLYRTTFSHPT